MNIKNIVLVSLLSAGLSLCAHAEDEDLSLNISENSKTNSVSLELTDKPYMSLIDEYTGDIINVWTSKSTGETVYHVDYPWIIRVPKNLERVRGPNHIHTIFVDPVEHEYLIYTGMYLASAPQCSIDQVVKELQKRGVKDPHVQPIVPERVKLSFSLIPEAQFICGNHNNETIMLESPLSELILAIPANSVDFFDSIFESNNFMVGGFWKEQVLVFKDPTQVDGKRECTFTSKMKLIPDHGIVSTVKLWPNGEEVNCKNGIAIIDAKNDFSYVAVTYSDGAKEVYSRENLLSGVNKCFGTIMLEYNEKVDPDTKQVISSSIVLRDKLYSSVFYQKTIESTEKLLVTD